MRIRRWLYRRGIRKQEHAQVPVISVGNLTMGGTGKTPVTILVAKFVQEQLGLSTAIVLRGYGRSTAGQVVVQGGLAPSSDPESGGDEAMVLAEALPNSIVIADEVRVRGAESAVKIGAEVVLLDDGYQHLALYRDFNILLVDTEEGIGTVLPFGKGREVLGAIRDADCVLFTNVENGKRAHKVAQKVGKWLRSDAMVAALKAVPTGVELVRTGATVGIDILEGKNVLAVSSIAKPIRFHRMVAECGAVVMPHVLQDHAEYSEFTVKRIYEHAERTGAEMIVTTTKDIVKARYYYQSLKSTLPVLVLHHTFEWMQNEAEFFAMLSERVRESRLKLGSAKESVVNNSR